jgi:hypothetical protein
MMGCVLLGFKPLLQAGTVTCWSRADMAQYLLCILPCSSGLGRGPERGFAFTGYMHLSHSL